MYSFLISSSEEEESESESENQIRHLEDEDYVESDEESLSSFESDRSVSRSPSRSRSLSPSISTPTSLAVQSSSKKPKLSRHDFPKPMKFKTLKLSNRKMSFASALANRSHNTNTIEMKLDYSNYAKVVRHITSWPYLSTLHIRVAHFGYRGCWELVELLEANPSIRSVTLERVTIVEDGALLLKTYLEQPTCGLTHLGFDSCKIKPKAIERELFGNMLQNNNTLTSLYIRAPFNTNIVKAISKGLAHNNTLVSLELHSVPVAFGFTNHEFEEVYNKTNQVISHLVLNDATLVSDCPLEHTSKAKLLNRTPAIKFPGD